VPIAAKASLEERLASRWLVWLGAVALALSGLFLILYAVEHGWIGPTARVALGLLLGIALAAAGEWTRRRPWQTRIAGQHTDHAPGALAGAGLFVAFASIYGAHALYGLIGPLTTFIGLALVAAAGFALAALHAPIVAVVGLLAGFATPLLVTSETPSAAGLFGYLALVVAAALGVVRYRDWAWLAVSAVTGGFLWTALWLIDAYRPGDLFVVTGYLGFLAATSIWLASEETPPDAPVLWRLRRPELSPQVFAFVVCLVAGLLAAWAIAETGGTVAPVLVLVAATVAAYLYGRRNERFDGLTIVAGVLLVSSLAGWPLGEMLRRAVELYTGPGASAGGLIAEPARQFLFIATGLAALVAGLGYRLLWGAKRPFVWAGVPTLTAALILALAYHRLGDVSDTIAVGGHRGACRAAGAGRGEDPRWPSRRAADAAGARLLCGRDGGRHRLCARLRAARCLADGGAVADAAGAGLDRQQARSAGDAGDRAGAGRRRARPAGAQPLRARLRCGRVSRRPLGDLRLRRAGGGLLCRFAAVRAVGQDRAGARRRGAGLCAAGGVARTAGAGRRAPSMRRASGCSRRACSRACGCWRGGAGRAPGRRTTESSTAMPPSSSSGWAGFACWACR
jgi:hypothetical protein